MPNTSTITVSSHAASVYHDAIVIDTHNDLPTRMLDGYDPDVRHEPGIGPDRGDTDLPRLMQSGLTAEFLVAYVGAEYAAAVPDQSWARAQAELDTIHAFVGRHPGQLMLATTSQDVLSAKREGKVAIFVGVEGGHAIENSLGKLDTLYDQGVRYLTLTWNNGNDWAGSSVGVNGTRTGGLTDFGKDVIHEMNRLGMLVDISHVSDSTFYDVLATTTEPVIASHSSARAIGEHVRDLSDDMLRAVARNGGVVNVNFFSLFLDSAYAARVDSVRKAVAAEEDAAAAKPGADSAAVHAEFAKRSAERIYAIPRPPLSLLIDHIDHVARVAGIDHVGIGSDFDGVDGLLPDGMRDVTDLPKIAQGLLDRGYTAPDVAKMLGGNMLRGIEVVLDRGPKPRE